ncbi:integumentary mucin A.1-like [Xenopus tropicalis]|uniref:Integumentary mucin A.1-like n=1 Tax=Xenopus tropicalis TaxID=8364 RepID=A0A8J1J2F7_XENTR|nr:integumentary mucin A.1-like [Xenopus tropicalis]
MYDLIHLAKKWLQPETLTGPQIVEWIVMDRYHKSLRSPLRKWLSHAEQTTADQLVEMIERYISAEELHLGSQGKTSWHTVPSMVPAWQYAAAYLDDVVIHSLDWQFDLPRVQPMLDSIRMAELTANPKKCSIGLEEAKYLGYNIDCAVAPADRVDCGYPGVTTADCTAQGCCFDSSIRNSLWCFYSAEDGPIRKLECSGDPKKRIDCGYPGVTEKQCKQNGCCFDNKIWGVKWCFKKQIGKAHFTTTPPPTTTTTTTTTTPTPTQNCAVAPADRVDCGYPGVTTADCRAQGCCFDSSISNSLWCFYSAEDGPIRKLECSGDPKQRIDCGYPGVTEKQCKQNGCCFDNKIWGVKWCFKKQTGKAHCRNTREVAGPQISSQSVEQKHCV